MFQTKVVQKIKTHIFCSVTFFKNHDVYETMWKNIGEPDRPQMIWHMSNKCWIPTVKNTHSEYVKLLLMYGNMVTCMHLNVTSYAYCLSFIVQPKYKEHANRHCMQAWQLYTYSHFTQMSFNNDVATGSFF